MWWFLLIPVLQGLPINQKIAQAGSQLKVVMYQATRICIIRVLGYVKRDEQINLFDGL